jgi:APA family basic amino acid/polyamine antiporter
MSIETAPSRVELPRVLGPVAAISCVVGSAIGSGIFLVPAAIATKVPYVGVIALVWIVAGLYSLAGALTLAELGAMLPHAGGSYVYLREAYGRLPAFLFGWTEFLVIRAGSVATLSAGFAYFFATVIPAPAGIDTRIWQLVIAIAAMVTVGVINVLGTRVGGGVQVAGTAIKLLALGLMIALPFVMGRADVSHLSPVWPSSVAPGLFEGFALAVVSALWAYDGWVNAGAMAEDIADPGRNVPRSLLWGMLTLIVVYLSTSLVYHLVLPISDVIQAGIIAPGNRPIAAEFCYRLLGDQGVTAISLAVMCSIFIALNGNAMSGPRSYFAMARDGLFPRALSVIHPRFQTPANAIIVQTVWAVALTVIGSLFLIVEPPAGGLPKGVLAAWKTFHEKPLYDVLYTYVLFGGTIFYTLAIASVFVLRKTRPDLPRPYRTWGYPITPILYLIFSVILMANMLFNTPFESVLGLGIIMVGGLIYAFFYRDAKPLTAAP